MDTQLNKARQAFEVAKRNLKFYSSTPDERRVIIAKDVISQIKARRISPQEGTYLLADFTNPGANCTACALGACFVSAAGFDDSIDLRAPKRSEFGQQAAMTSALEPYFTKRQLRLIESAFERQNFTGDASPVTKRAVNMGRRHEKDEDRLIAIMQNIITNKGRFKP